MTPIRWKNRLDASDFPPGRLSVAVFGPGVGEGIVVRSPEGDLLLFDGVRDANDPILALVDDLVAEGCSVHLACLTHPHLDHYRGMGRLLSKHAARLVLTSGLDPRVATQLVNVAAAMAESRTVPDQDDFESLGRALLEFARVNRSGGTWSQVQATKGGQYEIGGLDVHLVGPAQGDPMSATLEFLGSIEQALSGRAATSFDPNVASVAIALAWKQTRVLVTGDLVCGSGNYRGWSGAIVPKGPYALVSVAHHASEGADDAAMWSTITAGKPGVAVVTPFKNASGANPPRPRDIDRLLGRGWDVFMTSRPNWPGGRAPFKQEPEPWRARAHRPERNGGASEVAVFDDPGDTSAFLAVLNDAGEVESVTVSGLARRLLPP